MSKSGKGAVGNIIAAGPATHDLVVTAGADGTVQALDPRSELCQVLTVTMTDFPYSLAAAGGYAMCGCGDGSLHMISLAEGRTLYALGANTAAVRTLHASDNQLVASGDDGCVILYDFP